MVFDEMSLKPLQRYWIALASANFSKGSPSSLVGIDGRPFLVSRSLIALPVDVGEKMILRTLACFFYLIDCFFS